PYHSCRSQPTLSTTARRIPSRCSRPGSTRSMSYAPTAALNARHQSIRQAMTSRSLEALVVTHLPNILYLTNFTGSAAIVVVTHERVYFLTDFRYVTAVSGADGSGHASPGTELLTVEGSYDQTLAALLASLPLKRIGFESEHLVVSRHEWLSETLPHGDTSGPE